MDKLLILFIAGAKSDGEVASSPKFGTEEDSGLGNERGCTSDSELSVNQNIPSSSNTLSPELSPNTGGGWIMVWNVSLTNETRCIYIYLFISTITLDLWLLGYVG